MHTSILDSLDTADINRASFLKTAVAAGATLAGAEALWAASAHAASSQQRGGTLSVGVGTMSPVDTLDPFVQTVSEFEIVAAGQLFDPLVGLDQRLRPQPGLAQGWESRRGGRTWIFRLRPGIEFSDGSPITAADVVFSIRRVIHPKKGTPIAAQLGPYLKPANVRASGRSTVTLTLNAPYAFVPNVLASRFMKIVKAGTTDFRNPIGNGPFVVDSFSAGQSLTLRRNTNYWRRGRPYLDRVEFTNIPEASSRIASLLANNVDVIDNLDYALIPRVQRSAQHRTLRLRDSKWITIVPDMRFKPFNDLRISQALRLAIDRREILQTVFGGYGSIGYDTPFPSSDAFFDKGLRAPRRDVNRARALLRSAGYADGFEHELIAGPLFGSFMNFAIAAVEQAADAGFKLKLRQWPVATFFDQVWLKKPFYASYWLRRHADEVLSTVFTSNADWHETSLNAPSLDRAVVRARNTANFAGQRRIYGEVQRTILARDSHVVPLFLDTVWASSRRVNGVALTYQNVVDFTNTTRR